MISKKKNKVITKSVLAVFLSGTVLTGCGNTGEETTKETEAVTENDKNKENVKKGDYHTPTEIMTAEESNSLTAGQFISAEELIKIPNIRDLEYNGLTFLYVYAYLPEANKSNNNEYMYWRPIEEDLIANGMATKDNLEKCASEYNFVGIRILPIAQFIQEDDSTWLKWLEYEGQVINGGPVITEEKIKELNETQKTLQ